MKNIFKIIEYLPDTQQIVVRYARKNTNKNIDEYIESAVELKQLDLYNCETFSKSLMRRYGEHNIERVENETEGFNKCEKISGKLDIQNLIGKVIEVDADEYRREIIKMRRVEL
tara:strand:+ start:42 stop:383 length:342 start_codon:yes stop_codon:yes gene_type:complete